MEIDRSAWAVYRPGPISAWNFTGVDTPPIDAVYQKYFDRRTGETANVAAQATLLDPGHRSIYPELVRRGWGLNFQRSMPGLPCPAGWREPDSALARAEGWCQRAEDTFTPVFYSPLGKAGRTKTYYEGYAPRSWEVGIPFKSNYGFVMRKPKAGRPGFSENYLLAE